MGLLIPFTLFGSGIAFGIMLVILFIVLVASDIEEAGEYAFVAFLIAIGLNYFWGTLPLLLLLTFKNALSYVFIGFIFSLVRTYFKGKELSAKEKENFRLKDHVFRWWFLFPISAINWIFRKLLRDLFNLIYEKISVVYNTIFNA